MTQMDSSHTVGDEKQPLPRTAWVAALEQLSREDRERFTLADTAGKDMRLILTDVLKAANEKKSECMKKRWKVTINGREIVLRDVMEKISTWVDKILTVGDVVVQYDPGHAALPWAAIRLIMQATVNDTAVFGHVATSIEDVTNVISTCAVLELRYLRQEASISGIYKQLSEAIISLYTAVLRYLSAVLHYYGDGTAVRFLKSVAKSKADFEGKFGSIEGARKQVWDLMHLAEAEKTERILETVDNISGGLKSQNLAESQRYERLENMLKQLQEPISRLGTLSANIQDGLETPTRGQILRSISTIPYPTHHKMAKKGRLAGSGQWLLAKDQYKSWRKESSSSVLWLHGIPGSGKTKLTSLVIDDVSGCENLAYFYCMRNPAEPERGLGQAILASLVRQLASVSSRGPILPAVLAEYEDAIDGMAEFGDMAWTMEELERVLFDLLGEYPTVTLVLDALDEVNGDDRQELLDILSRLLQESPNILKVFISSRDNLDIALSLSGSPNVYIEAKDNSRDISSFIDERLDKARLLHGKLSDEMRSKIRQTLVDGARGMFRWVELQIQSLLPLKVAADIEERLGSLPATLEGSYWEVYRQIMESGKHASMLAVFTFRWLMYAQETITIDAFASISSVALSSPDKPRSSFTGRDVIDVCGNLVVRQKSSFELSHLSVREFFEGLNHRNVDTFLSPSSNAFIACACLRYLTYKIDAAVETPQDLEVSSGAPSRAESRQIWELNADNSIVRIACHKKLQFNMDATVLTALQKLVEMVKKIQHGGKVPKVDIEDDNNGDIQIRCACMQDLPCNIDATVAMALNTLREEATEPCMEAKGPETTIDEIKVIVTHEAPTVDALEVENKGETGEGETDETKKVEEEEEEEKEEVGQDGKEDGKTGALGVSPENAEQEDVAASKMCESVARALINQDRWGDVSYVATYWVHHANLGEDFRRSDPLMPLLRSFLVSDPNKVSKHFPSWCRLVRMLDSNSKPTWYGTQGEKMLDVTETPYNPMWLACFSNWIDVVEYLYAIGYKEIEKPWPPRPQRYGQSHIWDTETKHGRPEGGSTPLWYALYSDSLELADCILRCRSEPTPAGLPGSIKPQSLRSPLEKAAELNQKEFVKLFLSRDHGGQEGEGEAFAMAALNGQQDILELLLEHNADVMSSHGSMALGQAVEAQQKECAAFLLDGSRGLSVPGPTGDLILCSAARNDGADIMGLLLERPIGLGGMSKALIISVSDGAEKSTELLLAHGARREGPAVVNAIRADTPTAAARLIRAGFDVHGRYLEHRRTGLHFAVDKGFAEVVRALLDQGAAVDARDRNQQTPLHLGAWRGREECVRILLDAGADMLAEDREEKIPLDYAEASGREAVKSLIEERMLLLLEELKAKKRAAGGST